MKTRNALLCATIALAGCAASGPTGRELLTGSINPQVARLVIYRTNAMGLAVQPDYNVDNKKVGASTPNGFVVCELPPGRHQVSVANFALNVNLGGGTDTWQLDLKPGSTTYLLAEPKMGLTVGVVTLNQVTEMQGRNETAALYKLESNC
jgi:uncharacterized protein DUF2846